MSIIFNSTSNWMENIILNWILRADNAPAYTLSNRLYFSLYTADPTDDNTVALANEVSGSGYARVLTDLWTVSSTTGIAYMGTQIDFPTTGSIAWGTITDIGLCTTVTGGSLVFHAKVNPNDGVYIDAYHKFSLLSGPSGTVMGPSGAYSANFIAQIYNNLLNNYFLSPNGLNMYAKLFTTMPNISNVGGVEVPTTYGVNLPTGYQPVQIAGTSNWVSPTSGSTYNLNTITLIGKAQIDLGYVAGMCVYYIHSNYNQLALLCPFTEPINILKNDGLRFLPGELKIGVD